jgi:hypothetical protein
MRQGEVFGGVIGLIVVIIIIFAGSRGDHGTKTSQADQANLPAVSTSLVPVSGDIAPSDNLQQADPQGAAIDESSASQPTEDTMPVVQEAPTLGIERNNVQGGHASISASTNPQFPYKAYVIDSRGKIVVQGGPSIFYKNVEVLKSGESVWAASKDGKWISVQLLDGKIGYVRQRQLEFQ